MRGRLLLLVTSLFFVVLPRAEAAEASYRFSGTVDAAGTRYVPHALPLSGPSTIDVALDWPTAETDLNLVLKNASGGVMAQTTGPSTRPERIHYVYNGGATTWKIMAFARSGKSTYTIDVTVSTDEPPPSWNGDIHVWAAENEAARHDWSEPEAVDHAAKFDAFITIPRSYRTHVAKMKEANPALLLFAYVNGTHIAGNSDTTKWPATAFLYDSNGNRVKSARFGSFVMNPLDSTWVSSRAPACKETLAYSGYDNCYVDALATWGLTDVTAPPINPSSGAVMTKGEWLAATTDIARAVNNNEGSSKPLLGSGGFTGRHYFGFATSPPESQLFGGLDATIHEGFCRNPNAPIDSVYSEEWWKQDVEMIRDAETQGRMVLTLTKTWVTATPAQKSNRMKYCLASFLLGTNGRSMFGFTWDRGDATRYDPLWDTVLGAPSGGYQKADGVYQRSFSNGRVLVNSTSATATVQLGATYRTPSGEGVTTVTLPSHTAEVLTTG